jgi:hypothetical protein
MAEHHSDAQVRERRWRAGRECLRERALRGRMLEKTELIDNPACPRVPWHFAVPIFIGAIIVLALILLLLWKDTQGDSEQFFGIVKTFLSFLQVLTFPSGRVPLFKDRKIQAIYAKFVSVSDREPEREMVRRV